MSDAASSHPESPIEPPRERASIRQDVISGYVLALSRVGAWAGVTAYLYREAGPVVFGIFALLRGTISILSYTSLGLGPAMVHFLARTAARLPIPAVPLNADATHTPAEARVLSYASSLPETAPVSSREQVVMATGLFIARYLTALAVVGAFLATLVAGSYFEAQGVTAPWIRYAALWLGCGVAIRIVGETASAVLQVRGYLALDNVILSAAEICWVLIVIFAPLREVDSVAAAWAVCSIVATTCRVLAVAWLVPNFHAANNVDQDLRRSLLVYGGGVTLAQTADFLYAPCSSLIIQWLLGSEQLAAYAPLVQIDSAMLLAVAGIAGAIFPRAARSFAGNDRHELRRLYLRGTIASLMLLGAAGLAALLVAPWIFRLWLGEAPTQSLAILPLVLIHTVVGGSSGVGRSVLLGMGKVRAFVTSSLIAGAGNVVLGAILAGPVGLGLYGIVIGTITVVVARCAVWMPWYVLKQTAAQAAEHSSRGERDPGAQHPA